MCIRKKRQLHPRGAHFSAHFPLLVEPRSPMFLAECCSWWGTGCIFCFPRRLNLLGRISCPLPTSRGDASGVCCSWQTRHYCRQSWHSEVALDSIATRGQELLHHELLALSFGEGCLMERIPSEGSSPKQIILPLLLESFQSWQDFLLVSRPWTNLKNCAVDWSPLRSVDPKWNLPNTSCRLVFWDWNLPIVWRNSTEREIKVGNVFMRYRRQTFVMAMSSSSLHLTGFKSSSKC